MSDSKHQKIPLDIIVADITIASVRMHSAESAENLLYIQSPADRFIEDRLSVLQTDEDSGPTIRLVKFAGYGGADDVVQVVDLWQNLKAETINLDSIPPESFKYVLTTRPINSSFLRYFDRNSNFYDAVHKLNSDDESVTFEVDPLNPDTDSINEVIKGLYRPNSKRNNDQFKPTIVLSANKSDLKLLDVVAQAALSQDIPIRVYGKVDDYLSEDPERIDNNSIVETGSNLIKKASSYLENAVKIQSRSERVSQLNAALLL